QSDDASRVGGAGATERHALSLSKSPQSSDPVDRRVAGAAEDSRADLRAGLDDQDDGAPPAGRADGKDPRLGGKRGRGLHADLALVPRTREPSECRSVNQETVAAKRLHGLAS